MAFHPVEACIMFGVLPVRIVTPPSLSLSLFLFLFLSPAQGFNAMLYKGGEYQGLIKPGFHVLSPLYRVQYLVSKMWTVFDTPVKEVGAGSWRTQLGGWAAAKLWYLWQLWSRGCWAAVAAWQLSS